MRINIEAKSKVWILGPRSGMLSGDFMLQRGEILAVAFTAMSLWAGCGARTEIAGMGTGGIGGATGDGGDCSASCFQPAARIAVGRDHNCVRLEDGRLKCWGYNAHGQLGLGDTTQRGDDPGEMGDLLPAVELGSEAVIETFGAGQEHSCALLDDGRVKCWGFNAHGQLGLGDTNHRGDVPGEMGDNLPAVELGTGKIAVAIAVHGFHSCAILNDGAIKCWGANDSGQLGLGDANDRGDQPGEMGDDLPAVDLGLNRAVVAVASGHFDTCALLDDGAIKCWGNNIEGQLGLGNMSYRGDDPGEMGDNLPAVDLGAGETAVGLHLGTGHTCARLGDGTLKCWGNNADGQLGLGDAIHRGDDPGEMGDNLPAIDLGTGKTAVAVYPTWASTCALLQDGATKCWGSNVNAELGLGDTSARGDDSGEMGDYLPIVDIGTGIGITEISAHHHHTCALVDDGRLKCWGWNHYGQPGLGDTDNRGDTAGVSAHVGALEQGRGDENRVSRAHDQEVGFTAASDCARERRSPIRSFSARMNRYCWLRPMK